MRRQAFIARLVAGAAVLLTVVRVGAAAAVIFVLVWPAFPQDQQDATLACDRAAASPTDKNRASRFLREHRSESCDSGLSGGRGRGSGKCADSISIGPGLCCR